MIIVQLSDLHLRADGRYPRHDAGAALATAVTVINHMRPRPDAVLFTGDLLDRSTRDYGLVRSILDKLTVPLLPIPGNHDDDQGFRGAFADEIAYEPGHLSFSHRCSDALVIGLDSNGPNGTAMIDAARLDWLAVILSETACPVLIGMHHPPFKTGMPRFDDASFPGADALMRLLMPHASKVRIVTGHVHRPVHGVVNGIQVSTAPPLGYTLALALVPDAPHAHTPEAPAMQIHHITADGSITHTLALAPRDRVESMTGSGDANGRVSQGLDVYALARIIAP